MCNVRLAVAHTAPAAAVATLLQHLALARRPTAEVQDLYSQPADAPATTLDRQPRPLKRPSRPVTPEPERSAA